ncbi:MAG: phosphate/phosphite/phosphonate ABC transporter substrate-binding protein [Thermodesulfobacteriota bacterium]
MKRLVWALLALAALAGCQSQAPAGKELSGPVYRIGYMICNSEKETLARFTAMTAYLERKLGIRLEAAAIDTVDFTREVEGLHFTHTNSLLYVILQRLHGVEVLAAERKGSLGFRSQGVIMVRADSAIHGVADLKGRTMAFGPMLAPTGFMSQVALLMDSGLDPETDLAYYAIPSGSFKHEKVIYGVLFGRFDAGSIPLDDIETMVDDGRLGPDELRIIARAPAIPYCNFGYTQKVDERLAKAFGEAVLALTPEDTVEVGGERVRILARALVDGYEPITDADFEPVRELARRTNMPPYQRY